MICQLTCLLVALAQALIFFFTFVCRSHQSFLYLCVATKEECQEIRYLQKWHRFGISEKGNVDDLVKLTPLLIPPIVVVTPCGRIQDEVNKPAFFSVFVIEFQDRIALRSLLWLRILLDCQHKMEREKPPERMYFLRYSSSLDGYDDWL